MDNPRPRNQCGECKACCVVLPIAEPDFVKPAGEPCQHLCEMGCRLFGGPQLPKLCRDYFCEWRSHEWLNERPLYRPDKLGVIFQSSSPGVLSIFEVEPGALMSKQVAYIKERLKRKLGDVIVKKYPHGVLDGIRVDPATVKNGQVDLDTTLYEWQNDGGSELTFKRKVF